MIRELKAKGNFRLFQPISNGAEEVYAVTIGQIVKTEDPVVYKRLMATERFEDVTPIAPIVKTAVAEVKTDAKEDN